MAGLVFIGTRDLDGIREFYTSMMEMEIWLEQAECFILKHGNFLLGFCQREKEDTDGIFTLFFDTNEEVDRFYEKFKVPILVHASFFPEYKSKNVITSLNINNIKNLPPSIKEKRIPIHFFKDKVLKVNIGQEPLYLIHSPKHCHSLFFPWI